jgi:hypothetical protein
MAVCVLVAFVVIFAVAGALNLGGSGLAQAVLAAIAALIGIYAGRAVYARYFPGR